MTDNSSITQHAVPVIRLNDGRFIPRLGFGVWQIDDAKVDEAVKTAIDAGYRLIDTAQGYDNEPGVGRALESASVSREDLFVTTKLRTRAMGYDEAIAGVRASLQALQLDTLDMMLIHWPTPARDTYAATWKGLIEARKDGLVRTIGVSNFLPEHIDRIIEETGIIPAVNQIEMHPYFQQTEVHGYHERHGIRLEAYSPLGHGEVLDDPVVGGIAKEHGKSPAQVILRWHLQRDHIVIPKSETPERIRENLDVFGFELSPEEMAQIGKLDRPHGRTGSDPATFNDLY
jgi:2,5-diketo-D-gluconate reductase A